MPFIRNRVFGASVDPDTKKFFYNLQKGILDLPPNEEIGDAQPYRDYLGDSIPFVRMWTAIQISGSLEGTAGKEIKYFVVNDNNQISYQPNESIQRNIDRGEILTQRVPQLQSNPRMRPAAGITGVTTKTQGALGVIKSTTVEFTVYSFADFSTYFLPYFLKPGTRIIVDYGWSLKGDPNPLYDIDAIVKDSDDDLSKFYSTVFGERKNVGKKDESFVPGWINKEPRKGMVDTLFGEVVNYDVSRTDGKWQCSLEIKSSNTALLETEITDDNNLKFLFSDFIDTAIIAAVSGFDTGEYEALKENLDYLKPSKRQYLKDKFFTDLYHDVGETEEGKIITNSFGQFSPTSIRQGLFYEEINNVLDVAHEQEKLYINYGLFEDTFLNQALTVAKAQSEIFNPFDVSFNNIDSTVRYSPKLKERQREILEHHENIPEFLYPVNARGAVDWAGSYNIVKIMSLNYNVEPPATSRTELVDRKKSYPFTTSAQGNYFRKWVHVNYKDYTKKHHWDLSIRGSYNNTFIKDVWENGQVQSQGASSDVLQIGGDFPYVADLFISDTRFGERLITFDGEIISGEPPPPKPPPGEYPTNPSMTGTVPLREMFISIPLIIEAFSTKNNINDVFVHIWDSINNDSYNVFNIQMIPNNGAHSSIAFQDLNATNISNFIKTSETNKYNFLEFDVTSLNSIVTNVDLKFTMPKAGLGSMMAIQGLSGNQVYDVKSLDRLNLLKLFDQDRKHEGVTINSLPLVNKKDSLDTDFTSKINIDYSKIQPSFSNYAGVDKGTTLIEDIAAAMEAQDDAYEDNESTHTDIDKQIKDNRRQVKVAHSARDKLAKEAVRDHLLSGDDDSVSPILPIELGLTVHGNSFLEIGDFITINFLPKQYRDRSYFQIIGIEHKISSEGWETSYTLVFRVIPNAKGELVDANAQKFEVIYSRKYTTGEILGSGVDIGTNSSGADKFTKKMENLEATTDKVYVNVDKVGKKYNYTDISAKEDSDNTGYLLSSKDLISMKFSKPKTWDDVVWLYAFTITMLKTIGPTPHHNDKFIMEPRLISAPPGRSDSPHYSYGSVIPKDRGLGYFVYQTYYREKNEEFGWEGEDLYQNPSLIGSVYDYLSCLITNTQDEKHILGLIQPYADAGDIKLKKTTEVIASLGGRNIYFSYFLEDIGKNWDIFKFLKEDGSFSPFFGIDGSKGKPTVKKIVETGALIFENQWQTTRLHSKYPVIPPVIHYIQYPARTANLDQAAGSPYRLYMFNRKSQQDTGFTNVNYDGFGLSEYIFNTARNMNNIEGNKLPDDTDRIDNMQSFVKHFVETYYDIQNRFYALVSTKEFGTQIKK